MGDIRIPSVGESISTALISAWHKADGEMVAQGDLLLTLETDKVSTDLTASEAGLLKIAVPAGQEIAVGTVVGAIDPSGGAGAARTEPKAEKAEKGAESGAPSKPEGQRRPETAAPTAAAEARKPAQALVPVPASAPPSAPAPLTAPSFTVLTPPAAEAAPSSVTAAGDSPRTTRRRMSPLRRKIAVQLVSAQQNAAMLTTFNEADLSAVMKMRKELQESFTARHGVKLGFMSFFVKAVVDALKALPQVSSRIDGDDIVEHHYYDIGVAVSTERGLMVPVIRDCDRKSFAEIESAIADVATRARTGAIQLADLQGGVFTITNGGIFGSLLSTPILNPPQSGILGMHAIQERPVARDGQVVIRPMMYLALSYDHRVVDGREAVSFLVRVKECLENPARLLIGA